MNKVICLLLSATMMICLCGCNSNKNKYKLNSSVEKSEEEQVNVVYTKYDIPLPVELFKYIIGEQVPFNVDLLNNTSNSSKYSKEHCQGMALGLYCADIAYCSVYSKQQELLDFYNAAYEIADKLDISAGYNIKFVERLEDNISSSDSLSNIASESYWSACNYLDENGKYNILPFVVYGGWVESLYLTIKSNDSDSAKMMIINQKKGLLNLISYLYEVMIESTAFYYNSEIKLLIWKLNGLKTIYERIIDKDIDPQLYTDLCNKLISMRNEIVTP
ncbi:MAG: hypothetical protein MJ211_12940 [Bacteroidales bacterium]|nr:hypothetical protein [Bacteroidales bacterium]